MKKLRFLHIPKTAGSTFTKILKDKYRGTPKFVFSGKNEADIKRFRALSLDEQKAVTLFTGHASMITGLPEADDTTIITILRDPVARVKSFCQHVSEGKSPHLLEKFPPETFSLDEFLFSDNNEISNLQTRMLIDNEHHLAEPLVTNRSPEEMKSKALDNLYNKVTCFGIQEYFDESLILFADVLGWSMPFYEYRNKRDLKRLLKFENHHLARIQEINSVDIQLYEAAKEKFLSVTQSEDYNKKKLSIFKRANKLASPLLHVYGSTGRAVTRLLR